MTNAPPPAAPDDKDWTWVLERPCPECGYVTGSAPEEIPGRLRADVRSWAGVLAAPDVATRPAPTVWSPLEYGCHVRDVFEIFGGRLDQLLTVDDPLFDNWDQDATALASRYWESDPARTAAELTTAGEALAARFDTVSGTRWQRPGRRSNGSVFTVETLAWYCLHDVVHHLVDVGGSRTER